MRAEAAKQLVAELVAAFPFPTPPAATRALYQGELERLADEQAAAAAVAELVRSATRLPPIADLLEAYRVQLRRQVPALPAWQEVAEEPREPVPPETVAWLERRFGIRIESVLRDVDEAARPAAGEEER